MIAKITFAAHVLDVVDLVAVVPKVELQSTGERSRAGAGAALKVFVLLLLIS